MNGDLVSVAANVAMQAAARYLRVHNLKADDTKVCECLRAELKVELPKALKDVKDAFDAGMAQVAEATFLASMQLAGINAAKAATA